MVELCDDVINLIISNSQKYLLSFTTECIGRTENNLPKITLIIILIIILKNIVAEKSAILVILVKLFGGFVIVQPIYFNFPMPVIS